MRRKTTSQMSDPRMHNMKGAIVVAAALLLGFLSLSAENLQSAGNGPRIALLGDSMTWIGGDSCQNPTGWSHILKQSGFAGEIDVYARSGATWTNTASTRRNPGLYTELLHDDNVVFNQTVRLIERADTSDATPDIIVIFAGANDAWFDSKRPGIYEHINDRPDVVSDRLPGEATSLRGSIALVADMMERRFPEAVLLFVTPLQMSKTDASKTHRISDIIEREAEERGWITLRADRETGITHEQEAESPTYTYDGVHTNPEGAKILGEYILGHLQNLNSSNPHNTTTSQHHN